MKTLEITASTLEDAINTAIKQLYSDNTFNDNVFNIQLQRVIVSKSHGFIEKTYVLDCILVEVG